MARKRKILPPTTPLLCGHLTSKVFTLQWQRHVIDRMGKYLVCGRQGWSSSILERKLTAHATAISPSRRVGCLTSEQYVIITSGHCSRMERQRTPRTTMEHLKKSTPTSMNVTCGLQIALLLIPWITLFGVLISNDSTTHDN